MADTSNVGELVNWERAEVLMDFEPPNPSLIVAGKTRVPMEVALEPFEEVVVEPEYWPTKVLGDPGELGTEIVTPYSIRVSSSKLTLGTKGIELIGKDDQTQQVDIPGSS
jgi:hypothetical protein